MRRVDGERGQDRIDPLLERVPQMLVVFLSKFLPVHESDPLGGELGSELLGEHLVLAGDD